ncbi:hypothetical protein [Methylobacterium sp. 1030]|uniref:hypothetical protein n=1 Tax=Methylobacterium sp. 1030 TaxID=3156404 RepID=UPI003392895E
MSNFILPPRHTYKATWSPVYYYPVIGSNDCYTVGVVAFGDNGESIVLEANRLASLNCLFGTAAEQHVQFIRMSLDCLRDEIKDRGPAFFEQEMNLGGLVRLGQSSRGSGFDLRSIALSWLSKISTLHFSDTLDIALLREERVLADTATKKEPKLVPAIREEITVINPKLAVNFNAEFHPKGRLLPVRLGYSGEKIVANFDRIPQRNLGAALERIRSKLWLLAEHRDQTLHETSKSHEMLVVPAASIDRQTGEHDMDFIGKACADMEKEADRREIRFRQFASAQLAAQHIFSVEATGRPLHA